MLQVPFIRENKYLVINSLQKRNFDASQIISDVFLLMEEK